MLSITLKFTKARESTCRKSWETCCKKDTHCDKAFETIQRPRECGRRNQETISEQLSGLSGTRQESTFRKWSDMCIILQNWIQDGKPTPYYMCGASLCTRYSPYRGSLCWVRNQTTIRGLVSESSLIDDTAQYYSNIIYVL